MLIRTIEHAAVTYTNECLLITTRGGVENTTFEAKAEDTKIPRPRTALLRTDPLEVRTGILEAKAKHQRHRCNCSPKKKKVLKIFMAIAKKKGLQNFFQAISKKKGFQKNFKQSPREENKKRFLQIFSKISGVFQQNFNGSKNSPVLEPRTRQFSGTLGFEAKAKDLTFEAKAKNFKMCFRGQGRPPGLDL